MRQRETQGEGCEGHLSKMVRFNPRRCVLCRSCANSRSLETGSTRLEDGQMCHAGLELSSAVVECESYVRDPALPPNILSLRLEMFRPRKLAAEFKPRRIP